MPENLRARAGLASLAAVALLLLMALQGAHDALAMGPLLPQLAGDSSPDFEERRSVSIRDAYVRRG